MYCIGWGTQLCLYLFLHRKWEDDKVYFTDMLALYREANYPIQLLLFPEGTDLSEINKKKDRAYAEKNNLTINEFTLHPRTTGFIHCLRELRGPENKPVDICDIDIAFVGNIPQGEKQIIGGIIYLSSLMFLSLLQ